MKCTVFLDNLNESTHIASIEGGSYQEAATAVGRHPRLSADSNSVLSIYQVNDGDITIVDGFCLQVDKSGDNLEIIGGTKQILEEGVGFIAEMMDEIETSILYPSVAKVFKKQDLCDGEYTYCMHEDQNKNGFEASIFKRI